MPDYNDKYNLQISIILIKTINKYNLRLILFFYQMLHFFPT